MRSERGSVGAVNVVFACAGLTSASSFARNPSIRDQVGATPQLLSLALVCVGIGSVIAMPFTGRLTERFGSAAVVRVFATLSFLCWTAVSQVPNVPLLGAVMLLSGAGFGVWDVAMNVQGNLVEQRQGRVLMPLLHAVFSFGSVAGALLGAGFAALGISIKVQYPLVCGLATVAVIVATARFVDDRHPGSAVSGAGGQAFPATPVARMRVTRVEILIGAMMACTALGEGAANDWLAITLVDTRGVPEAFGALALGGFNLTMAVARIVGGRLIAQYGRVPVLRISGATATFGVLLLCLIHSPVTALIGAALWGLGLAVVFPSGISAAGDVGGRGRGPGHRPLPRQGGRIRPPVRLHRVPAGCAVDRPTHPLHPARPRAAFRRHRRRSDRADRRGREGTPVGRLFVRWSLPQD